MEAPLCCSSEPGFVAAPQYPTGHKPEHASRDRTDEHTGHASIRPQTGPSGKRHSGRARFNHLVSAGRSGRHGASASLRESSRRVPPLPAIGAIAPRRRIRRPLRPRSDRGPRLVSGRSGRAGRGRSDPSAAPGLRQRLRCCSHGLRAGAPWAKMAAMALFGSEARGAKVRAETERLGALALPQLAQEVMVRVYAPDGPGAGGSANYPATLKPFDITDKGIFSGVDKELRVPLEELVQEGMQQLMNSALVVVWLRFDLTGPRYRLTRAGRAALESDDTATRIAP